MHRNLDQRTEFPSHRERNREAVGGVYGGAGMDRCSISEVLGQLSTYIEADCQGLVPGDWIA